ncbi:MAG: CoA pyrophosphatase [Deltaproteobacteria bacterium]|nr:CoA pyrophosphatase [Deltaproteobacteria bacterium]MBW2594890.1 CoA pyrophosphatase [Deltaproteobacteria bacterium]
MNKDAIIRQIVERLGTAEINYHERTGGQDGRHEKWLEAGVLIPLFFKTGQSTDKGEFVFLLSKRSAAVSQSGDLSGPGGKLEPFLDRFLRFFIVRLCPSILNGDALMYARKRGDAAFDSITLFLANAVRESWEEIRLSPFNIRFLGPLPPYSLRLFTKTIFPVVGLVEKKWNFHPNREVDKIVEIPLEAFCNEDNYGFFSIYSPADETETGWKFPCLIHEDNDGKEEILWGATFNIIMSFLEIVFDFKPPQIHPQKIITRVLHPDYLTGNLKRRSKLLDKILQDR